ncbi:MAG: putative two-component regulator sensor kinase [Bacteroidetes bacterium]|nr:putative two-component regulator sensor kinase [Bacteroidota bacterium]
MIIKNNISIRILINIFAILIFTSIYSCKKTSSVSFSNNQLIDSFIQQAQDSLYNNITLSKNLLKKAMKIAPDSIMYYKAYSTYALAYSAINQYDSSLLLSHQVINFCKRQELSPRIYDLLASSNNNIGVYYGQMSKQDSALSYFKEALKQYELANNTNRIPDMYINLADMYSRKGDFAMSTYYYRKALSKSYSLKITEKMGFPIYFGLGQIYMELRDFELSDTYFRLAEKFYSNRTLAEKFTFCNNRGNFYYYKEEYNKALPWFQKAKKLVSKGDYQFYVSLCELNLGDIYLNLNKLDSVPYCLDKSYSYFSTIKNKTALYYISTIRAGLALKQKNTQLARKLLEGTKDSLGVEANIISIRNKYLQKYYAQTGNFKQAYYYQSKNIAIDDSIRNDKAEKRISEIDLRYKQDTILVNNKLIIQKQASQMKSLRYVSFIWILVCLIGLLQQIKYMDKLIKIRMENIRNRVSPHFIFNIINNEICSSNENERKNLYNLATLMRKNLEISENTKVLLAEELDFVKLYIELEKRNLGDDFRIEWNIDNGIDLNEVFILPMSVQIPVENAIKHALRPKKGDKILSINLEKEKEGINVFIRDNGAGYFPQQESQTKGTGNGLRILFQTIQLLNSKNIDKISLNIQNIRNNNEDIRGAEVHIFIPEKYKFE